VEDRDPRGTEESGHLEGLPQVYAGPVLHLPLREKPEGSDESDEQEREVPVEPEAFDLFAVS
jgi:hypothetical protein